MPKKSRQRVVQNEDNGMPAGGVTMDKEKKWKLTDIMAEHKRADLPLLRPAERAFNYVSDEDPALYSDGDDDGNRESWDLETRRREQPAAKIQGVATKNKTKARRIQSDSPKPIRSNPSAQASR